MKDVNEFSLVMSRHSDEDLILIITKYRSEYQLNAIIAAEAELSKRDSTLSQDNRASYMIVEDDKQIVNEIKKTKISNKRLSFYISLTYVGLGTIFMLSYWTSANPIGLNATFGIILFCLFLPVSFISIVIAFAEKDSGVIILIVQTLLLFIVWAIIYQILNSFRYKVK